MGKAARKYTRNSWSGKDKETHKEIKHTNTVIDLYVNDLLFVRKGLLSHRV